MLRAADRYEKTFMTRLLLKQAALVILLCFLAGFDGCCNIAITLIDRLPTLPPAPPAPSNASDAGGVGPPGAPPFFASFAKRVGARLSTQANPRLAPFPS